jgi:hypothetical protein
LALEEPQAEDQKIEVDGVVLSIPPDVAHILKIYQGSTLDHDPKRRGLGRFHVRLSARRSWCS